MNSTRNTNPFHRVALSNLSNSNSNANHIFANKSSQNVFPSSLKNNNNCDSSFPFSNNSQKYTINVVGSNDPENSNPRANFLSQPTRADAFFFGLKPTNDNHGMMDHLKSPEPFKTKKPFLLQAVTPQERINDNLRHEKKRLSYSMPQEDKSDTSYVPNDRFLIEEDHSEKIKSLQKKINFGNEFITFDSHFGSDAFNAPQTQNNIYADFGIDLGPTEGEFMEEEVHERRVDNMVDAFLRDDLNDFKFGHEEEIFM